MISNRKAAMELTMGTMVTIVLVVAALILGLVLVQKIFSGATESVDEINLKVMGEINKLFADETSNVVVKLSGNKARIKAGTEEFGIAIAASDPDGDLATTSSMTYTLTLKEGVRDDCLSRIGKQKTENLILQKSDTPIEFDIADGSNVGARVQLSIPKGTPLCSQKVGIKVEKAGTSVGENFFVFEIIKSGILG